jgi:hypothetical protein
MSEPDIYHITATARARDKELARELQGIEKRDWWLWGYTIVVMLVLTFGIISLALPAVRQGAETVFRVRLVEAISGLIGFVPLLNIYTIYQQVLIKRLRRQLAERQSHWDILRNLAMTP